jgi:hypothetical protein
MQREAQRQNQEQREIESTAAATAAGRRVFTVPEPLVTASWNTSPDIAVDVPETVSVAEVVPVYEPPSVRSTSADVPERARIHW